MNLKCQDCKKVLEWKGKGRKPKRCKPCSTAAKRKSNEKTIRRSRLHEKGQSASRWGELWLTDGKAIRREARYVWGATGDHDDVVSNRGGVFRFCGRDGLPDQGMSTRDKSLQGLLRTMEWELKESKEAKAWLKANPTWWRFETFAHESLSRDVTESVTLHASTYVDEPDETSPKHRCSWCGERRMLVLAGEFCSPACFEDYVRTYGPAGLDLGTVVLEDDIGIEEAA